MKQSFYQQQQQQQLPQQSYSLKQSAAQSFKDLLVYKNGFRLPHYFVNEAAAITTTTTATTAGISSQLQQQQQQRFLHTQSLTATKKDDEDNHNKSSRIQATSTDQLFSMSNSVMLPTLSSRRQIMARDMIANIKSNRKQLHNSITHSRQNASSMQSNRYHSFQQKQTLFEPPWGIVAHTATADPNSASSFTRFISQKQQLDHGRPTTSQHSIRSQTSVHTDSQNRSEVSSAKKRKRGGSSLDDRSEWNVPTSKRPFVTLSEAILKRKLHLSQVGKSQAISSHINEGNRTSQPYVGGLLIANSNQMRESKPISKNNLYESIGFDVNIMTIERDNNAGLLGSKATGVQLNKRPTPITSAAEQKQLQKSEQKNTSSSVALEKRQEQRRLMAIDFEAVLENLRQQQKMDQEVLVIKQKVISESPPKQQQQQQPLIRQEGIQSSLSKLRVFEVKDDGFMVSSTKSKTDVAIAASTAVLDAIQERRLITNEILFPNKKQAQYSCYFLRGNNSGLVRRVLLTRSHWKEAQLNTSMVNFRWFPFSKGINFEHMSIHKTRMVNHFEFHAEITTKNGLIRNLANYCAENKGDKKVSVFDLTPCTFLFDVKSKFWDLELLQFCEFFYKHLPSHLKGRPEFKKATMEIRSKHRCLTIKPSSAQITLPQSISNVKAQQRQKNRSLTENDRTLHTTYKQGQSLPPLPSLTVDQFQDLKLHPTFVASNNASNYIWLLKPTNLNRGRGIELFQDLSALEALLNNYINGFPEQPVEFANSNNNYNNDYNDDNNTISQEPLEDHLQLNFNKLCQSVPVVAHTQNVSSSPPPPPPVVVALNPIEISRQLSLDKQEQAKKLADKTLKQQPKVTKKQPLQQPTQYPFPSKRDIANQYSKKQSELQQCYIMQENSFVIQKYIERPLLLNKRKFDIRMWVLVTHQLDVLLFSEGYIRTSSEAFDLQNASNVFIHLTNNAIQKYSQNYGTFESGNQLSLAQFDEYFADSNHTFGEHVMPSIVELVKDSLLSVKHKLNMNKRKYCFELFGYDFFIDEDFKVWLIEVNTNPCIEESSPLLEMLLPRMIDDALKLTLDVVFPAPSSTDEEENTRRDCVYPVKNYADNENMFKFLVNLSQ